jgi:hypothetical protein
MGQTSMAHIAENELAKMLDGFRKQDADTRDGHLVNKFMRLKRKDQIEALAYLVFALMGDWDDRKHKADLISSLFELGKASGETRQ